MSSFWIIWSLRVNGIINLPQLTIAPGIESFVFMTIIPLKTQQILLVKSKKSSLLPSNKSKQIMVLNFQRNLAGIYKTLASTIEKQKYDHLKRMGRSKDHTELIMRSSIRSIVLFRLPTALNFSKSGKKSTMKKRPHMALQGKTPKEYLMEKLKNHALNRTGNFPVKSVVDVG